MDETTPMTRQELGMSKVRAWHDWRWIAAVAGLMAAIGIVAFSLSAVDNGRLLDELKTQGDQLEVQTARLDRNQAVLDELLRDSNENEQRTLVEIGDLHRQLRAASTQIDGLVAQLNELGAVPRLNQVTAPSPSSTSPNTTTTTTTPGRSDPPGQEGKIKKKG